MRAAAALPLLLALTPALATAEEPRVYFSPEGDFPHALARALLDAKQSIDLALYSFQTTSKADEEDYAALVKAAQITPLDALRERLKAGVKVRVVLNHATTDKANAKTAGELLAAGAEVYTVSGTMHSKYAIIDGRRVINGSGNWSIGAFNRYHENWIVFPPDAELAAAFQRNMDQMLGERRRLKLEKDGALKLEQSDKAPKASKKPSASAGVVFTSDNEDGKTTIVEDLIVEHMRAAKKSLFVAVAHFNTDRLADELVKAHKRGVAIRVLVDLGEYSNRVSQAGALEKAGIDLRYQVYSVKMFFPFAQLMHHKAMLVDGKTLLTGSYNWSRTAEWGNHENIQVLNQPAIVAAFTRELEALWELRRDTLPTFMRRLTAKKGSDDYRRFLPCHFPPMALDGKEMGALRRAYVKAGFAMRGYKGNQSTCEFWSLDQEKRQGTNDLPEPPHKPFFDQTALVISEVCFDPQRQRSGEYVELFNGTGAEVDLTELVLSDGDAEDHLVAYGKRSTKLGPGQVALVVDPDLDGDYELPKGVVVVTVGDKSLGNGLSADDVVSLKDAAGKVIDSCTLTSGKPSLHRRNLQQASDPSNWESGPASPGVVAGSSK